MSYKKIVFMFYVWLCVYLLVTGMMYAIKSLAPNLAVPVQTMIATLILVPVIINWVVPFAKTWAERSVSSEKPKLYLVKNND